MKLHAMGAALAVLLVSGCTSMQTQQQAQMATPAHLFAASLDPAAVARTETVGPPLVRIAPDNPKLTWRDTPAGPQVLVASTMSAQAYDSYYKGKTAGAAPSAWGVMWVTAVPQLQELCKATPGDAAAKTERVVQFLGLDPARDYSRVVEMWVSPATMARPCPSMDVTAEHCALDTSTTAARPTCSAGDAGCLEQQSYWDWFGQNMRANYKTGGAPWTRLGYTFDWKTTPSGYARYGASEFILKPLTPYEIKGSKTLAEYCTP
jgi:hypothetical protein